MLNVPHKFHVNVSVNKLAYTGPGTMECAYGGMASMEQVNGEDKEILSLYGTYAGGNLSKDILFLGSALFIVVYWYDKYSKINVSMSVIKIE